MKSCKDLGLELCIGCQCEISNRSGTFRWACIITTYMRYLEKGIDKTILTKILTDGTLYSITGNRERLSCYYMKAVLKEYYPEYLDWFEKLLVLK